jgi:hypothetical protein
LQRNFFSTAFYRFSEEQETTHTRFPRAAVYSTMVLQYCNAILQLQDPTAARDSPRDKNRVHDALPAAARVVCNKLALLLLLCRQLACAGRAQLVLSAFCCSVMLVSRLACQQCVRAAAAGTPTLSAIARRLRAPASVRPVRQCVLGQPISVPLHLRAASSTASASPSYDMGATVAALATEPLPYVTERERFMWVRKPRSVLIVKKIGSKGADELVRSPLLCDFVFVFAFVVRSFALVVPRD